MLRCSAILVLTFIKLTVQSEELEVLTKLYMNKGSKKSKIFLRAMVLCFWNWADADIP